MSNVNFADTALADRRAAIVGNGLGVASMILWAAGFPVADSLLERWDPLLLITMRLGLGVLPLLALWFLLEGPRAVFGAAWGRGLWVGGLGFGVGTWLLLLAQSLTDAVTVAIIASLIPVAGATLEVVFDGRRLRPVFVLGLVISVSGGIVATGASGATGTLGWGALAGVGSVGLYAWASRATVHSFRGGSTLASVSLTLTGGFVTMACVTALALGSGIIHLPEVAGRYDAVLIGVYALLALTISHFVWIESVRLLGVAIASFHVNVAPFYVMLLMLMLGGGWNWLQAGGALVVVAGVVVAQRR